MRSVSLASKIVDAVNRLALIITCAVLIAIATVVFFLFRGWFSTWPPSPDELLSHKDFTWRTHETSDFWIHYEAKSYAEKELALLTELHESAMPGMLELLGESDYPIKIHIFAVESRAHMKLLIGREGNGKAFPEHNTMLCVFSERTKAGGAHELMHVLSNNLWGEVPFEDRIWLDEGLACLAEDTCYEGHPEWDKDMHAICNERWGNQNLTKLEQLTGGFENWVSLSSDISYPQAGSFVRFLYERYGRDMLKRLWQGADADLARVYGKSLTELESEWHGAIISSNANRSQAAVATEEN